MTVNVLIVDDEAPLRRLISRTLARHGYECHAVEGAEAARRSLANVKIDLMISDIRMPNESGLDLIRSIIGKYPQMAIILVSGLDNGDVVESAIDIGVDGYITKPFQQNQLLISIELALSHRKLAMENNHHRQELEDRVTKRTQKLEKTVKGLVAARREIKKTKAIFEGLFTNAKVGIAICKPDPRGKDLIFVDFNPAAENMDGKSRHKVLHRPVQEVFPKTVHLGLIDWAQSVSRTGRPEHHLVDIKRKDKHEWRDYYLYRLLNGEVVVIYTDETERILAERRLRDQFKFIQNMMESIPSPIFYKGHDGRYIGCNKAFADLVGLSIEAVVGLKADELVPQDLAQKYMDIDRNLLAHGGKCQIETQVQAADGTCRDFILSKRSYTEDGKITGIVGVLVDICERKQTEANLKESEAAFRAITENAQDAIIKMDDRGHVTHWNRAAEVIFGYSAAETIGKPLHQMIAPSHYQTDNQRAMGHFRHTGEGSAIGNIQELTAKKKNGEEFPVEVSIASVCLNGVWHAIGIVRDVTTRHQMENRLWQKNAKLKAIRVDLEAQNRHLEKMHEELKQAQQQTVQQEKMASIGQLAAGVAHEINNPTGFVSSNLKSLQDYLEDLFRLVGAYGELRSLLENALPHAIGAAVAEERLTEIKRIEDDIDLEFLMSDTFDLIRESREGTDRIKKIIIDLKDFAHPGQHERMTADINRNIESVLNIVWNELKYKATMNKDLGDLPPVECYPQQLNQVFMNLLVNAGHAMDNMGEIHIATRTAGDHVEIAIRDTGCGIPEENLKRIFDPFFTTKPVGKGTGLGLNVAYNIIKKHGGEIKAASQVGEGTTFTIRLPIELPENAAPTANQPNDDTGASYACQAS